MTDAPKYSAGWYPDPTGAAGERYHDGTNWTGQYVPYVMPNKTTNAKVALALSILGVSVVTGLTLIGLITNDRPTTVATSAAPTVNPSFSTPAPLAHGPQGHMTADPEPSACADAPVTSVNTINSGFLSPDEHLIDTQAVVVGGATYVGANIAGNRPEMGNKISSQDMWAVYMGRVYAITSDARNRTNFPDGRHVAGLESWADANAALGHCVGALERARNGGH